MVEMLRKEAGFNSVIVRFGGEIGVKGAWTRKTYERLLLKNVEKTLAFHKVMYREVSRSFGRLYVKTCAVEEAAKRLLKVFGVSSVSPAAETSSRLEDITGRSVLAAESSFREGENFAVKCRRIGQHEYTSLDVCSTVGSEILRALGGRGVKVDLNHPTRTVNVEIRGESAYVFLDRLQGADGFPLGSQPKLVGLLSGGVDSAVACWLAMKRGCPVVPVYMDNTPFSDEKATRRALETAEALFEWAVGFPRRVYVVPHGENLKQITEKAPARLTCVICKRMMYRIAERVADLEKAVGVVTGESIGEQASQTLINLRVIDEAAAKYPVYRPLLGYNKVETESLARKIGVFQAVKMEAADCSAVPKRPATSSELSKVKDAEKRLDIDEMVEASIRNLELHTLKLL